MEGTAATSKTDSVALGVLELGTNSLKLHLSREDLEPLQPLRVEWDVGYEVFSSGRISKKTVCSALGQIHAILAEHGLQTASTPVVGIATGAFREAEGTGFLQERLDDEEGIPLRILTAEEEASLLIEGTSGLVPERPGMAFDLGGGSVDMVFFGRDGSCLRENLPLGAIRLHHLGLLGSGVWDERPAQKWIEKSLQYARAFNLPVIHGTGGTVKAIAQVAGIDSIPLDLLASLHDEARSRGAPQCLSKRRRTLFLPGLLAVIGMVRHFGAGTLRCMKVEIGEILAARLHPFRDALRGSLCRSILFQHFDVFLPGRFPLLAIGRGAAGGDNDRAGGTPREPGFPV